MRRSETFEGNVSEGKTLKRMLKGLGAPVGALVVMDAGIATEANLIWLSEHGYRYLVVSRERARQFEAETETAIPIETAAGSTVHIQRVDDLDKKEVRLYCYSEQREEKEHTCSSPYWPTNLCKSFAGNCTNTASRDAGVVCGKFCPCNSASQRPSGVLMAAPCISAKPRARKRSWRPFTKP